MQIHGVTHTTTATTATAIPAPGAGARLTVVGLHVSAAGATTVTVGFSSGNQRVYTFTGAGIFDVGVMRWEGDPNTAITVQSSGAVAVDATVDAITETSPG